jgi:hypothetical protein
MEEYFKPTLRNLLYTKMRYITANDINTNYAKMFKIARKLFAEIAIFKVGPVYMVTIKKNGFIFIDAYVYKLAEDNSTVKVDTMIEPNSYPAIKKFLYGWKP